MAMTYEEAMEKVRKLLKLGGSSNANEAATACAMAQSIMDRYGIEKVVEEDSASEPEEPILNFGNEFGAHLDCGLRLITWRTTLANMVAMHNGCKIFTTKKVVEGQVQQTIEIIGRTNDVRTTRYMFGWLRNEIDNLADRQKGGKDKSWMNNFRLGCCETIGQKLREARKATVQEIKQTYQQNTNVAMVRVDQAVAKWENRLKDVTSWTEENMNLRNRAPVKSSYNWTARAAGRTAAQSINISNPSRTLSSGAKQLR